MARTLHEVDGSRPENHHDAETLLATITPGGTRAASQLRQARHLVEFAEGVLRQPPPG
ncbi:MAG TPA: hypothetical protein VNV42_08955 [Solirubrobacteraceae bacterium]|nr:hypothetical protein [Solirubrobacteraceae bacterium]